MTRIARRFGPIAMAGVFMAAAAVLWGETFRDDYHLSRASHAMGPAFFPRIVLTGMLLLGALAILDAWRREAGTAPLEGAGRVLALIGVTIAYGISIAWIGFVLASFAFVVAVSLVLGYRHVAVVVPVAAAYAFAVWYMFQHVLLIILPASPWFDSF